jgi:hypothetical protein
MPSTSVLVLWFALAAMFLLFLVAWFVAGIDPRLESGPETTEPPLAIGAAGMRYLALREYDHACFAAALLELRRHGHIEIDEDETIRVRDGEAGPLHAPERELLAALREDPADLPEAELRFAMELHDALEPRYLTRNRPFVAAIRLPSLVGLLWLLFFTPVGDGWAPAAFLAAVTPGVVGVLYFFWRAEARRRGDAAFRRWYLALGALAVHGLLTWLWTTRYASWQVAPLAALTYAFPVMAASLLRSPTREGRELLAKVLGFRQGLGLLDDDERLGDYLPYAVALGFENAWNNRFRSD